MRHSAEEERAAFADDFGRPAVEWPSQSDADHAFQGRPKDDFAGERVPASSHGCDSHRDWRRSASSDAAEGKECGRVTSALRKESVRPFVGATAEEMARRLGIELGPSESDEDCVDPLELGAALCLASTLN
jgi:hypothetical protein